MKLGVLFNIAKRLLLVGLFVLVFSGGLLFNFSSTASASTEAGAVVRDRAEGEVDRMLGSGTTNQVKGKAQEQAGKVQRQLGDDASGTAREVRGKVQKNVGRAQEAAEDASEDAEGLVGKVKDFFN